MRRREWCLTHVIGSAGAVRSTATATKAHGAVHEDRWIKDEYLGPSSMQQAVVVQMR